MQSTIASLFREKFQQEPVLVKSPGRINLIGEHTDYNMGFVLPAAIDKAVYIAIAPRPDNELHWIAADFDSEFKGSVNALQQSPLEWPNYIQGVIEQLQKAGHTIGGFNLVLGGDVPSGAGLSSSAAVECATAFALNTIFKLGIGKIEMVKLAQAAENEFVGVKCGIMDQFASMMGQKDHVMKLDCRSLAYEYFPFKMNGIEVVLFDTRVKHSLAGSEYNQRRQECEAGVAEIAKKHPEVKSLRDASIDMVEDCLAAGDPKVYDRCKYVVEEIARLQAACTDLLNDNLKAFGEKMFATHDGLSKLYEVSCPELDFLAAEARKEPAIWGARMMGGGFGGCTINIIEKGKAGAVIEKISAAYKAAFNVDLMHYEVIIGDGTSLLNNSVN